MDFMTHLWKLGNLSRIVNMIKSLNFLYSSFLFLALYLSHGAIFGGFFSFSISFLPYFLHLTYLALISFIALHVTGRIF